MIVPFGHVLVLAAMLFLMGAACAVSRRNLIMIVLGVEIMLNAVGLALVGASLHWGKVDGQILVIFVMTAAAAEVAVGLALIVRAQRQSGTLDADEYDALKE